MPSIRLILAHVAGVEHGLGAVAGPSRAARPAARHPPRQSQSCGRLASLRWSASFCSQAASAAAPLLLPLLAALAIPARAVLKDLVEVRGSARSQWHRCQRWVHGLGLGHVLHHMDDVVVIKAAHHMHDGIAPRGCGPGTCCPACTLAGTLTRPAMSTNSTMAGVFLFVCQIFGQLVQPLVRHGYDAAVGLNGAEGVVGGFRVLGGSDGVEQSGLADVRQTRRYLTSYKIRSLHVFWHNDTTIIIRDENPERKGDGRKTTFTRRSSILYCS